MTATADYSDGKVPKNETAFPLFIIIIITNITFRWVSRSVQFIVQFIDSMPHGRQRSRPVAKILRFVSDHTQ